MWVAKGYGRIVSLAIVRLAFGMFRPYKKALLGNGVGL
jgi:hypothetical protein